MIRFNFFEQAGAFSRDEATGTYRVNLPQFEQAVKDLSNRLLTLQGNGDYAAVDAFVAEMGNVGPQLQADLDRLASRPIPVDIVFEQGSEVLGLYGNGRWSVASSSRSAARFCVIRGAH